MNELQVFSNPQFGELRTVELNGEPWLVGKDVAEALGYTNPSKALADHVDDEDKLNNESLLSLGQRGGWLINESGFYSLVLSSKLPGAKKFKRWVTSEVLPAIRKNGGYINGQERMAPEELMAKALLVAQRTIERQKASLDAAQEANRALQPKALFADAVSAAKTSILVGELAKLLKQNGVAMGQNRLFEWLRTNGFLIRRRGVDFNMPTQRAMELGLFEIKETVIAHADGHTSVSKTPKITGKGQSYFVNRFLSGRAPAEGKQSS
ncbi:MAG: hypothetical protein HFF18_12835 [Oscillospiraceae bacterium]|nr:hypothetical protein [Oscillospiraceae bacterium]